MTLTLIRDLSFLTAAVTALLPFVAFVLIILFTRNRPKISAGISVGAVMGSAASALFLFIRCRHLEVPVQYTGRWLVAKTFDVPVGILPR